MTRHYVYLDVSRMILRANDTGRRCTCLMFSRQQTFYVRLKVNNKIYTVSIYVSWCIMYVCIIYIYTVPSIPSWNGPMPEDTAAAHGSPWYPLQSHAFRWSNLMGKSLEKGYNGQALGMVRPQLEVQKMTWEFCNVLWFWTLFNL